MTSVGRGRGWGRNTEETTLRRPGRCPVQKDELIKRIREINFSDIPSIQEPSSPIAEIVTDKHNLTNLEKLYNEALEDRNFISNVVSIFLHPSNCFAALLVLLQRDYDQREELWNASPAKYLNFICLMGAVFQRPSMFPVRKVISPVASAIISLCKILLKSSGEEEIEIVMNQIWLNGEKLNAVKPNELLELINYMKEVLILKNLSTKSRAMLLYAIDLSHNNYSTLLDSELQKFYDLHLSKEIFEHLVNQRTLVLSTESQDSENQCRSELNPNKGNKFEDNDSHKYDHGNQARPRAIRGSGVNGSRDEEKKNIKKSLSNRSDGKKGWGHDDRFERDY